MKLNNPTPSNMRQFHYILKRGFLRVFKKNKFDAYFKHKLLFPALLYNSQWTILLQWAVSVTSDRQKCPRITLTYSAAYEGHAL